MDIRFDSFGLSVGLSRNSTGAFGHVCCFGRVFTFYHDGGLLRFGSYRTA